jgi:hypothetical protein
LGVRGDAPATEASSSTKNAASVCIVPVCREETGQFRLLLT